MLSGLYRKLSNIFIRWLSKEPYTLIGATLCDYDRLCYEIRPGDVILIEGRSRISNVIRSVSQSHWTHAALYIGRIHDIDNTSLKKILRRQLKTKENVGLVIESILGKGTIVTPISFYKGSHIRICRPTGLSPEDAQLVIKHAIDALGNPYSVRKLFDLARFVLPWTLLPRRWGSSLFRISTGEIESGICSSLIAESFASVHFPILPMIQPQESGVKMIARNPHLYSPRDFDDSPYFEIIKYPINPEEETPYYRRMPWASDIVHNDNQSVTEPSSKIKTTKSFLRNLTQKKSKKLEQKTSTKITNEDNTEKKPLEIKKPTSPENPINGEKKEKF